MNKIVLGLCLVFALTGCSSMKKSLLTGAAVGGGLGAAIGNSQGRGDNRNRKTNNGLLIGAGLGMLIGYLGHKDKEARMSKMPQSTQKKGDKTPLLTMPKIKRVWVEDKVQGKRFIKGHWEFVIEENSTWSKE